VFVSRQRARELKGVPLPKGESHQNNWNRKRKVRGAEDGSVHEIVALSANYGEAVLKLRLFGPSLFIH
jgi:hypothetical protein